MPPTPHASSLFDKHEATLDELAGVGRNHRFDAIVDDEDDERIEVVCRRPNPNSTGGSSQVRERGGESE